MIHNQISEVLKEVAEQKEAIILEQLNDFISRGLIVVENGPMSFFHDSMSNKVNIQQSCKLVLKDKEYIEKLEKENQNLKGILDAMQKAVCSTEY